MQDDLKPKNLQEVAYGLGGAVLGGGGSFISEGYEGAKEGFEYRYVGWEKGSKYGQKIGSRIGRNVGGALGEATGHSISAGIKSAILNDNFSPLALEYVHETCNPASEDYPVKPDFNKVISRSLKLM